MSRFARLVKALSNPYVVMCIVIAMYVLKAALKITIGSRINSPMIAGDGYHNLADILEASAVVAVIFVAKLPAGSNYPFGRKNIEFFSSLAIGLGLLFLSLQFALKSVTGLLSFFPDVDGALRAWLPLPEHQALVMDDGTFPLVLAITISSVILSFFVSRYQIAIGKRAGHASLVADGEETASDGRIELVTLCGVLAEYVFHAAWLEYPLGLLVAFMIGRTGYQLFGGSWKVLLQHSLGKEHELRIRQTCMATPGVLDVVSLKTFRVGDTAICMVTIETNRLSSAIAFMKYGIEQALSVYLLDNDFKECELHIRFQKSQPMRHRVAYALRVEAELTVVVADLQSATHLAICDMERGQVHRSKLEPIPQDVLALLTEKRVGLVYVFGATQERALANGIPVKQAPCYLPESLGLVG